MKRTLRLATAVAVLFGLSAVANAATVTVSANQPNYLPGQNIILTISTNAEGASFTDAFVQVNYAGGLVGAPVAAVQVAGPGYFTGSLTTPDIAGSWKTAINQFAFAPTNPGTQISSTVTLQALVPGIQTFTLGSGQPGQAFTFGGAAAGASVQVTIVPEPTTAALLGLGLFGLAVAGRRR